MNTDQEVNNNGLSTSQFYMWRAVFAMAHADDVITDDERDFMYKAIGNHAFSDFQKDILLNDIENKQDIASMFSFITEQEDRSKFFYYARMLCWSDGDFDTQEQEILTRLKRSYLQNVDFDKIMQDVSLELDDDDKDKMNDDRAHFDSLKGEHKKRGLFGWFSGFFR